MKYFLEHKTKRKWLTDKEYGYVLTDDPNKAMSFDKMEVAKLYLYLNKLEGTLNDFMITEHEFVPPAKCEQALVIKSVCEIEGCNLPATCNGKCGGHCDCLAG